MNIYNKPGELVIIVEEFSEDETPLDYAPGNDKGFTQVATAPLGGIETPPYPTVDLSQAIGIEYLIYKYDTSGCLYATPVTSGNISLDHVTARIQLPDGKYYVEVSLLNSDQISTVPITKTFYVIYNQLPSIVKEIQQIFCSRNCKDCEELTEERLLKAFFNLSLFLNCTGLIEALPSFRKVSCDYNSAIVSACETSRLYGNFKFNYIKSSLKLLAISVIEMYNREVSQLRDTNLDLPSIKSLFNIDTISRCLYSIDLSYDILLGDIKQINCGCHE